MQKLYSTCLSQCNVVNCCFPVVCSHQHGTRHIVECLNKAGHSIDTLFLCGGLSKNELFIQTHADVTGMFILVYFLIYYTSIESRGNASGCDLS